MTEKGKNTNLQARVLTADERDELWPKIVAAYTGYGGYQEKTSRIIPVVVLEPAYGTHLVSDGRPLLTPYRC